MEYLKEKKKRQKKKEINCSSFGSIESKNVLVFAKKFLSILSSDIVFM